MSKITFGTDGWRGIIAKDFTFENIEIVAYATAEYYKNHLKISNGLVIGYDARFLSKEFAEAVAAILANSGITVYFPNSLVSTPMVGVVTLKYQSAGGIMITASHNPPIYNGFKLKSDYGGPARREEIKGVESFLDNIEKNYFRLKQKLDISFSQFVKKEVIKVINFKDIYFDDINKKLDLEYIKSSNLRILYDAMYGAGQGILDESFPKIVKIHNNFNPSFNFTNPEPLVQNCKDTIQKIKDEKFDVGMVVDGDADRFGMIDENGNFVTTQQLFPIFLKYLVEERKIKGDVVRTVSVSDIVEKMCDKYQLFSYETPVGFKYITEYMISQDILIGGEESGGIGLKTHLPERDGIFNSLFLFEIMLKRNKKLSELVEEIYSEYGKLFYDRIDFHTTPEKKDKIIGKCKEGVDFLAGYKVLRTKNIDGFKFIFDDSWLLIRASGTEPMVRFYCESKNEEKVQKLLNAAVKLQ